MGFIKELFYRLLGPGPYLRVVSGLFIFLNRSGIFRLLGLFPLHCFVNRLIRKDDHVIDIGANLGYFTSIFAENVGSEGKVVAVEPVELYRRVLSKNIRKYTNVEIMPYALGSEDKNAIMAVPDRYRSRHGLTRLIPNSTSAKNGSFFRVEVRKAGILFKNISKLDYIKCDIEGYESVVIPELQYVIEKFKPLIQIELSNKSVKEITTFLINFGYEPFYLDGGLLTNVQIASQPEGDLFFLTDEHKERYNNLIKNV